MGASTTPGFSGGIERASSPSKMHIDKHFVACPIFGLNAQQFLDFCQNNIEYNACHLREVSLQVTLRCSRLCRSYSSR